MKDRKMWAIYNSHNEMVWIESRNKDTKKLLSSRPMCTHDIAQVGKLMEEVEGMAEKKEKGTFYVVRGTFIPEEKL